ncbi:MAG: ABC transporter substrate-binding protein [Chitinispirillaceae bacterium]|nr:ABC transporter substrate-binding protein [Chitinispirillaceae bacterium]
MNRYVPEFLLMFICAVAGIIAAGCSKKEASVVFAVGGAPAEIDFWEKTIQRFEEQSGIPVELLRQPTDTDQRRQNLVTALRASRSTPDLFLMDVAWIAQFAASEWLEPLAPFLEGSPLSINVFFEPVIRTAATYNGTLLALPVYVDAGLLYYRKDLLEKYGFAKPPELWDELVAMAHTIIRGESQEGNELTGFVWQGAQYEGLVCTFLEFAGSNGGGITIADSLPIVATDRNRSALAFMHGLVHSEKISPVNTGTDMKEEEVRFSFQKGAALFERNWPYAYSLHQADDSPVKGKTGIAVLPRFVGGTSAATLGGWHIGLSRFSRQKERAFALIAYLLSYEVQKASALEAGWNPGRTDIYGDSTIMERLPHLVTLHDVFSHAVSRPNVPWYSYLSSVLQRWLNAALTGTVPVDEALNKCEKELRVIVERYSTRKQH